MQPLKSLLARLDRLSWSKVYLFFAVPIGLFLVFATPPFQTPDAASHFFRATQISQGEWLAYRFNGTSGGRIDENAAKFAAVYDPMEGRSNIKATRAMAESVRHLHWDGKRVEAGFPNTAIYPAFTYLPQALAVALGRAVHMTVWGTYRLTCVIGLLVSVLLSAWAIAIARRSACFLFVLALLPTTMMISASVSQEVVMIPLCFLIIAYFERFVVLHTVLGGRWRWFLGAAIVICASARPTYGALVLLLFYPGLGVSPGDGYRFWTRAVLAVVIGAASLIAMKVFQSPAWTPANPPRSVPGQLDFLLHHPTAVFSIAIQTLHAWGAFYVESFIGVLGWLDAPLAQSFYPAACVALAAALIIASLDRDPYDRASNAWRLMLIVPMLVCFALTFVALYLTWTPVGQMVVEGVQGRYLTALVPLLALATPKLGLASSSDRQAAVLARQVLTLVVLVMPAYAFQQIVMTVIDRFYLQ